MLESLFNPEVIAVIGASRTPGKVGYEILSNLIEGGFKGKIVPVNPSAKEILGINCYSNLKEYGKNVELSIISIPADLVVKAVEDSLRAGAKAICVISAGFKETGAEGARLEQDIIRLCHNNKARLLGPNCLGLINTSNSMNASFATRMPKAGKISVFSQSGALCTAILDRAAEHCIGFSKLVSIGNKADLNENEFFSYFASDNNTSVIAGYLESIVSGKDFIRAAEAASNIKPVIILKTGTTKAGVKAVSSHTGSMAGADIAYGAAFKQCGVIRAETFDEFFDYTTAFAMQPLPRGNRVAIITNAGGPGIMAADAVEKQGMQVAILATNTSTALRKKLPEQASVGNPIDVLGDADPERYKEAVDAAQKDDSVDAIIVILTPQAMTRPSDTARAISSCKSGNKPVLVSFMGGKDVKTARDELVKMNLPDYSSPERAVAALRVMYEYAAWRNRPERIVTRFPVNRRPVERIIARGLRIGQTYIGEDQAKEILRSYNFNVPAGRLCVNAEEAVETAKQIGFPIAMKIVSPDIVHKSDIGGVRLNLGTPDEVLDAYDLIMLRIHRVLPKVRLDGVYVEKMCVPGREMIIGMTRDPQFGPMLMFGMGGIFVEVMKDVSFHLAPITANEALQMLESTKSYTLLQGARGGAGVNISSIADCLQRISQLVSDFPQIKELDINPLIVGEFSSEPAVADARIILSP